MKALPIRRSWARLKRFYPWRPCPICGGGRLRLRNAIGVCSRCVGLAHRNRARAAQLLDQHHLGTRCHLEEIPPARYEEGQAPDSPART